jgi:hypothetical protein
MGKEFAHKLRRKKRFPLFYANFALKNVIMLCEINEFSYFCNSLIILCEL